MTAVENKPNLEKNFFSPCGGGGSQSEKLVSKDKGDISVALLRQLLGQVQTGGYLTGDVLHQYNTVLQSLGTAVGEDMEARFHMDNTNEVNNLHKTYHKVTLAASNFMVAESHVHRGQMVLLYRVFSGH